MSVLEAWRDCTCELGGNCSRRKSMSEGYEVMSRSVFYLSPQDYPKKSLHTQATFAFFLAYLSFEDQL